MLSAVLLGGGNNQSAGKTWVYEYDSRGNILSKKTYVYTTTTPGSLLDEQLYYYSGDKNTYFDGNYRTYDEVGNPLNYERIAEDGTYHCFKFDWQKGRQLASTTIDSTVYSYTYDADGIRTSKTVGNTTYKYYTNGGQLQAMTISTGSAVTTMQFYYNALGTPVAFKYNGTLYYYLTNLQGDVIGIINDYGVCATYTYDAWGRIVATTSATSLEETLLNENPLRYRGYIYDTETGFYYLQSRYYDPQVGRFINGDSIVPKATGSCKGYNLYAYCFNNPVNMSDSTGNWPTWDDVAKLYEAFVRSIDIEFGFGFGFGFSKNICGVDVEAAAYQDGITVGVKDGDSYTSTSGSAGVSAKLADSLGLDYSLSYEHRFETNLERTNCEDIDAYSMFWDVLSCEHTSIDTPDGVSTSLKFVSFDDLSISFSGSKHVGVGYHYSVNFNLYEFFEVLFE